MRPSYPPGTWRIGSIRGIDVLVRSSWLLVALLISYIVAPRIEQVSPGLGAWKYVAGVAFAVLLYLSILLHEISHAVMAQRYGLGVRSISLHFLGGATEIDSETRTPGQEFKVAVVGPLTSIVVGLAALALFTVTPEGLLKFSVGGLAGANLLVGVLNLVPGLPLDGGRVLRALVWKVTGNMHRGTIVAGWGGRVIAVVLLLSLPLARVFGFRPDVFDFAMAGDHRRLPVVRSHGLDGQRARAAAPARTQGASARPPGRGGARTRSPSPRPYVGRRRARRGRS